MYVLYAKNNLTEGGNTIQTYFTIVLNVFSPILTKYTPFIETGIIVFSSGDTTE